MELSATHRLTIAEITRTAARARRRDLLAMITGECGWVVQSGPFVGMTLPERAARDDGDLLSYVLGCHEAELHPVLADIAEEPPDLIINIGAAEGYYAAGLARMLPAVFIHAFDANPTAQEICRQTAALNEVGSRVSVIGRCSPELLNAIVPRGRKPLVLSDCGGAEKELLDPGRVAALRGATLVVECHDHLDRTITQTLAERFNQTHTVMGVRESSRDPNQHTVLQSFDSLDRWLAVCEFRPATTHWLIGRPKEN